MKEIADARSIVAGDAQFFSHVLVQQFGERLGGFDAQTVQIEVTGEFAVVKKFFGDLRGAAADGDAGESDDVESSCRPAGEEIGDAEAAGPPLGWEGGTREFLPSLTCCR